MKNAILALFTFAYLGAVDVETSKERDNFGKQGHVVADQAHENEWLVDRVLDHLKKHYHGFNVNVYVNEGEVTLKGTVRSAEDKQTIETEVKGMTGVTEVKNELEIKK